MADDGPRAGLDDVPWAALWHAYGPADDVPRQLRAMVAGDREGRYPPSAQLANHIVHQGTRSPAALPAVPFLVQMALDPRMADRHGIVALLRSIVIGLDNNYLPGGCDPEDARAYLAELRGEAENWGQQIADTPDEERRKDLEESCEQVLIMAEVDVRCYNAVQEALPELAVLLDSDSPELRAETANLLAWFPESAATLIPLLKSFVADEPSPGAAATGIVSLSLLGDPTTVPFIQRHLHSSIIELRWASAFALTRFGITDPAVIDMLTETVARPPGKTETMSFLSGSFMGLSAMALAETSGAAVLQAATAMLTGLDRCTGAEWYHDRYYTESALFELAFPDNPAELPRSISDLTDVQQHVVRSIADQERIMWTPDAADAFRRWNVPTSRSDLRAYAGLTLNG